MNRLPVASKIILLVILMQTGCTGFHKANSPLKRHNKCQAPLSKECSYAMDLWKNTINPIVWANYLFEIGYYQSVVWQDDFNNAWVIKGHEINITQQFFLKLNRPQRLCVAAHELAHLKLGHYYSKVGIIMATQPPLRNTSYQNHLFDHYGSTSKKQTAIIAEGFGFNEEEEADQLALVFVRKLGLDPMHYLNLLLLFQHSSKGKDLNIQKRVRNVENILNI